MKGLAEKGKDAYIHPQNAYIALLLDIGMIGMLVLIVLIARSAARFKTNWDYNYPIYPIAAALFLYLFFIGMTETFIGFTVTNCIYIYFYTFFLIFAVKIKKTKYEITTTVTDNIA